MQTIVVIVIIVIIGWFVFDKPKPNNYTGYFYYNPNNLDQYWTQQGMKSINECRDWVNEQIDSDYDKSYDYECGKNCTFRDKYSAVICETTER